MWILFRTSVRYFSDKHQERMTNCTPHPICRLKPLIFLSDVFSFINCHCCTPGKTGPDKTKLWISPRHFLTGFKNTANLTKSSIKSSILYLISTRTVCAPHGVPYCVSNMWEEKPQVNYDKRRTTVGISADLQRSHAQIPLHTTR